MKAEKKGGAKKEKSVGDEPAEKRPKKAKSEKTKSSKKPKKEKAPGPEGGDEPAPPSKGGKSKGKKDGGIGSTLAMRMDNV